MKRDLNMWLTILSNVAVFIGLALVAFELNQAQRQIEVAGLGDAADDYVQAMQILSSSEELSLLIFRAETDYESLNEYERWRVFKWLDGFAILSEQDYHVMSRLDDRTGFNGFVVDWNEFMRLPMYREYWDARKERFSYEFRAFVDRRIQETKNPT